MTILLVALVVLIVGGAVLLTAEWLIRLRPAKYNRLQRNVEEIDEAPRDASIKG